MLEVKYGKVGGMCSSDDTNYFRIDIDGEILQNESRLMRVYRILVEEKGMRSKIPAIQSLDFESPEALNHEL